jgi:hypothetical protein
MALPDVGVDCGAGAGLTVVCAIAIIGKAIANTVAANSIFFIRFLLCSSNEGPLFRGTPSELRESWFISKLDFWSP